MVKKRAVSYGLYPFLLIGIFLIFSFFAYFVYPILTTSSFFTLRGIKKPNDTKPIATTIVLGGDVMLGRSVEIETTKSKDYRYPFLMASDTTRMADISFVNLENPIIKNCPPHNSGFTFCANPEMLEGLSYAGIDVVTLANNHTLNYGVRGLDETVEHVEEKGIQYTGRNNIAVIERNGTTFGFIGIDKAQLGHPKLTDEEKELISNSDAKVDVLIVAPHWGVEYKSSPLQGVRALAYELVSLGADVVVGSHPHWVQDREYVFQNDVNLPTETPSSSLIPRNDKTPDSIKNALDVSYELDSRLRGNDKDQSRIVPIYYSLGNFVFDQMWSEETKSGLVVRLTFEDGNLTKEELMSTYMRKTGQPEFVKE